MKYAQILILLLSLSLSTSCKEDINPLGTPYGTYIGTFERYHEKSDVNLTLSANKFSGTSSKDKFPAICTGSYTQFNDKLVFQDSCNWTADFDWSLILSGDYVYKYDGETLIFGKNDQEYRLKLLD